MISRQTSLTRNLVQFCRWLRMQRFPVGVEEESLALRALLVTNIGNSKIFFEVLRAILCRTKSQLEVFDQLYDEYWKNLQAAVDSKITNVKTNTGQKKAADSFESLKTWLYGKNENNVEESPAYSPSDKYSQKDFSKLSGDEIEEMQLAIKAMAKRMLSKLERRKVPSPDIYIPDLRRTLRKNLRVGGELMHIVHKRPKRSRSKLIVICDTSRSMELYTSFLIRFMYAIQQVYKRMETFVFSTSMHRVTNLLKRENFSMVKDLLGNESKGWSEGTRIGESLEIFVDQFGRNLIDSRTKVIIISDGLDTSGIDKIETNMDYIHKKAKQVIWLNPLASYIGYKPEAVAMLAAMPYVDILAPIYNLESLKRLGEILST